MDESTWFIFFLLSIGVCAILEGVIKVIEKIMLTLKGLWRTIGLLFKRNLLMPHVRLVLTTHGKILWPFIFTYI
jgi:hypothetical protein